MKAKNKLGKKFKLELEMTDEEYLSKMKEIEREFEVKKKILRSQYLELNKKFSVGMDIGNGEKAIRITKVYNSVTYSKIPQIYYQGILLTKKMEPNKRGDSYSFSHSDPNIYQIIRPS